MKILVVTFPNDLGSRTIEANLVKFVSMFADVRHFRFAAQDSEKIDQKIDHKRNLTRRFQDMFRLRSEVRRAVSEGRKILFYNISPALFAYGSWRRGEAFITMDWARRLLADKSRPDLDPMTWIHRRVLHACKAVLPMTGAMAECLSSDYGLPARQIRPVTSLFDVARFDPGSIRRNNGIKLLFVGGDVIRKGGDLLHRAFCERLSDKCQLTMVTNADLPENKNLKLIRGVRYGTQEHIELMQTHDLFVLPTREDAGPQVIGEAAAAGMAVFTTRFALGAPHVVENGVTGVIADSPDDCIRALETCLAAPDGILAMRAESLEKMRRDFSPEIIVSAFARGMG